MHHYKDYKEYQEYQPVKVIVRMDPDCAICHSSVSAGCDCEARGLEVATRQAEQRMMSSVYEDIREWVRSHARDYILEYYSLLTERRKKAHDQHLERITQQAYMYYRTPPHPSEIANAQALLKRGIDEDWQTSVQRYPEVLDYFYGLVELTLPPDDDPMVRDPPLSAMSGSRKATRRPAQSTAVTTTNGNIPPQIAGPGPAMNPMYGHPREAIQPRGRTPPPPQPASQPPPSERMDRRTPAPRRASFRPPPPPSSFYPPY